MDEAQVRQVACEEVEDALEPIRKSLWGPLHPSGTGQRVTDQGMESQLKEVHEIVTNGGRKRTTREKVDLALIKASQAVVIAVIVKVF